MTNEEVRSGSTEFVGWRQTETGRYGKRPVSCDRFDKNREERLCIILAYFSRDGTVVMEPVLTIGEGTEGGKETPRERKRPGCEGAVW